MTYLFNHRWLTVMLALLLSLFTWGVTLSSVAAVTDRQTPPLATNPWPKDYSPFSQSARQSPYPKPTRQRLQRSRSGAAVRHSPVQILTALQMQAAAALPTFQIIAPVASSIQGLQITVQTRAFQGTPPIALPPLPQQADPFVDSQWVDNWALLFAEGFEGALPWAGCTTVGTTSDPNLSRWGAASGSVATGRKAAWPAADNLVHAAPSRYNYPTHLDSWLVCGPFDFAQADKVLVRYQQRLAIGDAAGDSFFFGVSTNGRRFQGIALSGFTGDWLTQQMYVEGVNGQHTVWFAWVFTSDGDGPSSEGVWLDDLAVWRYTRPANICGSLAEGAKGVVISPYDPTAATPAFIIRQDDTRVLANLKAAGVHWVRFGMQQLGGSVDLQGYDRLVDTLCAQGIGVLGLLNHEALPRQDYNRRDDEVAAAYRAEFASASAFFAHYFAQRVTYWEIWNEPNLAEGAYLPAARYAALLQESTTAIRQADPQAQILFGGLASAWPDSNEYLKAVYAVWDTQMGGARPYDHLAVHPYPRKLEGPNPAVYLYADQRHGYTTILDKLLQTMAAHSDGHKTIWITELGWNSAKQSRNRPWCLGGTLVQEAEQATFLKTGFDILLNEVKLWEQKEVPAVDKVFWYQYMDVGTFDPCRRTRTVSSVHRDWWFGLYKGDKITPKPVWCAFVAYPQVCNNNKVTG